MHLGPTALLLVAVGACNQAAAEGEGEPRQGPPARVETVRGRTGVLLVTHTYFGTVRASARAELAAGADGQVVAIGVREGDRVRAGQVLARIDSSVARSQLEAAEAAEQRSGAQVTVAASAAERFRGAGPSTVSQLEIDRAVADAVALEATRRGSSAEVARARATLDRHRVVAPFAGVISVRSADVGDWVSLGTPVLELVADEDAEVLARIDPELLPDVRVGAVATLRRNRAETEAVVVGVVDVLDPVTRTAQLRLRPREPQPWLYAGAAVDVVISVERDGDGLIVPRDALVEGVAQARVVRVIDGAAAPLPVEVVERGASEARVRAEGLSPNDVFVTRGNERLREGQPLQVVAP